MSDYKITCCSTCDLAASHLKKIGADYALYHYVIDGVDYLDDLFLSKTPAEFYGAIDGGAMPTTSQVTPEQLLTMLEPILKEGLDVLHIEFSSGLSGGWEQSALVAQKILKEKYPARKIYFVDSLAASSGYGLLVDKAAELKAGGMGIDELYKWLEANKLRVRHWFFTTNQPDAFKARRQSFGSRRGDREHAEYLPRNGRQFGRQTYRPQKGYGQKESACRTSCENARASGGRGRVFG